MLLVCVGFEMVNQTEGTSSYVTLETSPQQLAETMFVFLLA